MASNVSLPVNKQKGTMTAIAKYKTQIEFLDDIGIVEFNDILINAAIKYDVLNQDFTNVLSKDRNLKEIEVEVNEAKAVWDAAMQKFNDIKNG